MSKIENSTPKNSPVLVGRPRHRKKRLPQGRTGAREGGQRRPLPPKEFLHERLRHDPESGKLFWRQRPLHHFLSTWKWNNWNSRYAESEAGCICRGKWKRPLAVVIRLEYQGFRFLYYAHQLVLQMHGIECPNDMEIDHKDRDPTNNRLSNLRVVTHKVNMENSANCIS